MLVAQRALSLEGAAVERLQREQPELVRAVVGQELLGAGDGEIAVEILCAEAATPALAGRLDELGAALIAGGVETRADRATLLQLEVAVIRIAAAQLDGIERIGTP